VTRGKVASQFPAEDPDFSHLAFCQTVYPEIFHDIATFQKNISILKISPKLTKNREKWILR